MVQSALSHEHMEKLSSHASQKDYAQGFGGRYGVQKDHVDKSAMGYDYAGKTEKHASQKGTFTVFGKVFMLN